MTKFSALGQNKNFEAKIKVNYTEERKRHQKASRTRTLPSTELPRFELLEEVAGRPAHDWREGAAAQPGTWHGLCTCQGLRPQRGWAAMVSAWCTQEALLEEAWELIIYLFLIIYRPGTKVYFYKQWFFNWESFQQSCPWTLDSG